MSVRLAALLLGLSLAVTTGWWWSWDQFSRSPISGKIAPARPAPILVGGDQIDAILADAPWVSPGLGDDKVLYKVGFRHCSDCVAFAKAMFPKLHAAGVDTRVMLYAPSSGKYEAGAEEKAALAALYRSRDWALYEDWMSGPPQVYYARMDHPSVAGDEDAVAAIETGRAIHDGVAEVLAANGWQMERPALLWKGADGRWRVFLGDTERGRRFVARAFGVED